MAILEYFGSSDTLQYHVQGKYFDDKKMEALSVGDFLVVLLSPDREKVEGIQLTSLDVLFQRAGCTLEPNPSLLLLVKTAIQDYLIDEKIEGMIRRFVQGVVIPVD